MKQWPDWTQEEKLLKNNKIKLQPSNDELFSSAVVTEEQIKKSEKEWNNKFKALGFKGPIDHLNKSAVADKEWKSGKSFNSMLSEEEKKERNSFVGSE